MRSFRSAACLATLALATPAEAQLRPSPLGDIYESYNDCFKVAAQGGMKPEELAPLGWSRATISAQDGKKVSDGPSIHGHANRKPLIMLSAEKGEGLCIVMARLENAGAFEEFTKAWGGELPQPDAEGTISFSAEGHIVQLRKTGSLQEPSLSIAVMTPMESK
ncbi:MAG: hypothetical protein M3438_07150 [Pseudomonadota bacterium]|nr:hypothetical protein [Sphingomonas sp.]MDQ3478917.1 hypothetical protein [Pseudomonadota bacterium]